MAESSSAETIEGINIESMIRSLYVRSVFTWPTNKARTTDTSDTITSNSPKDNTNASGHEQKIKKPHT